MLIPGKISLYLQRGQDFGCTITVYDEAGAPFDLTGLTPRAQIREFKGQTGEPLVDLQPAGDDAQGIVVLEPPSGGQVQIVVDRATILGWPENADPSQNQRFFVDVTFSDGERIGRWLEGPAYVAAGVTLDD